jgi:hypothetical protein
MGQTPEGARKAVITNRTRDPKYYQKMSARRNAAKRAKKEAAWLASQSGSVSDTSKPKIAIQSQRLNERNVAVRSEGSTSTSPTRRGVRGRLQSLADRIDDAWRFFG